MIHACLRVLLRGGPAWRLCMNQACYIMLHLFIISAEISDPLAHTLHFSSVTHSHHILNFTALFLFIFEFFTAF